jgi:hypothetical protein
MLKSRDYHRSEKPLLPPIELGSPFAPVIAKKSALTTQLSVGKMQKLADFCGFQVDAGETQLAKNSDL